ncbi:hypothetical protein BDZ89DRAFT_1057831 [Hymenopellis radicata]|nr:hypothetical protein BDZ89DRAFT_1057831 [Hymenopellis radicata]
MDITPDCSMMDVDESEEVLSQLPQTQVGLAWKASQIPALRVIAAQELFPSSKKRHRDQPTPFQHFAHNEHSTPAASVASTSHRSTRPLRRTTSSTIELSTLELNPEPPVIGRDVLKIIASQVDEKTRRRSRQLAKESSNKNHKSRMSMPPPSSSHATLRPISSCAPDSPASDVSMLSDCSMDIDSPSSLSASSFARDCQATSTQSSFRNMPPPSDVPHRVTVKGHRATEKQSPGLPKPAAVPKQQTPAVPVKGSSQQRTQPKQLGTSPRSGPPPLGMRRAATTPICLKQEPSSQQKSFKSPLLPSSAPIQGITVKKEEVDPPPSQDPDSSFDFGSFDEFDPELLDEVLSKVEEEKKRKKPSR